MNARCALVDLSALSVEIFTLSGIGWEIHPKNLKDKWNQDPGMISLSTGALSGTGAPGSGAFCWCFCLRNKFQIIPVEGRFGAVCRYGGIDNMLIKGEAKQPISMIVRDGEFAFLPIESRQPGASRLYRNIRRQFDGNVAIMTVGAREILEDGTFRIGDSLLARKLRRKNLLSIAVMATGSIPIHSPESFLAVCQEIYQARRGKRRDEAQISLSRYLSIKDATDDGRAFPPLAMESDGVQSTVESMLGLYWGNGFPLDNPLLHASRLLNAYSDKPMTISSLEKCALESIIAAQTMRCGKEKSLSHAR